MEWQLRSGEKSEMDRKERQQKFLPSIDYVIQPTCRATGDSTIK
jgi:hypothetical protein